MSYGLFKARFVASEADRDRHSQLEVGRLGSQAESDVDVEQHVAVEDHRGAELEHGGRSPGALERHSVDARLARSRERKPGSQRDVGTRGEDCAKAQAVRVSNLYAHAIDIVGAIPRVGNGTHE